LLTTPSGDPDERSLALRFLSQMGSGEAGVGERDEARSGEEANAKPAREYASMKVGAAGSGGAEYATIAQAPDHGTLLGSRGF
jgi:hypothetical protein